MDKLKQEQMIKRFKTLAWNVLYVGVAGIIDVVIAHLADFNLPTEATTILGLVLAQISKYLARK